MNEFVVEARHCSMTSLTGSLIKGTRLLNPKKLQLFCLLHDPTRKFKQHANFQQYQDNQSSTINHFYEKLLLLKDRLHTDTAKRMAVVQYRYMEPFLKSFTLKGMDDVKNYFVDFGSLCNNSKVMVWAASSVGTVYMPYTLKSYQIVDPINELQIDRIFRDLLLKYFQHKLSLTTFSHLASELLCDHIIGYRLKIKNVRLYEALEAAEDLIYIQDKYLLFSEDIKFLKKFLYNKK